MYDKIVQVSHKSQELDQLLSFSVVHGNGQGFLGHDDHEQALAPGDPGIDEVSLQYDLLVTGVQISVDRYSE
ncbi:MAG: hypothetical protein R6V55_01985 [Desulfovermiculus sp.]